MVMRFLTKSRPRCRPRPVGPLCVQHAHRILVGMGLAKALLRQGFRRFMRRLDELGQLTATEAVCGDHASSMSPLKRVARAIRAGRAERSGPLTPFTVMTLWRSDDSPRARLRKWGAPLPVLRYRLKRGTQAPLGEKTS
jgi:hypothetical protein